MEKRDVGIPTLKRMKLFLVLFLFLFAFSLNAQVVINEIMVMPGPDGTSPTDQSLSNCNNSTWGREFVEFYNNSDCPLDISCYIFITESFDGARDGAFRFPSGTIIQSRGFISIGGPNSGATINLFDYCSSSYLSTANVRWYLENGDAWCALYSDSGSLLDAVFWTSNPNESSKWPTDSDLDDVPKYIPNGSASSCPSVSALNRPLGTVGTGDLQIEYAGKPTLGTVLERTTDGGNTWGSSATSTINSCNGDCSTSSPSFILNAIIRQPSCTKPDGEISFNPTPSDSYTYTWTPNVSSSSSAKDLPVGTYRVKISSTSGCSRDTTIVLATSNQTAITDMDTTICSNGTFNLIPKNGTNGIIAPGTTFNWPEPIVTGGLEDGAAGDNATNIGGTLINPTNTPQTAKYIVTPVSANCLGEQFIVTITVNPLPKINDTTIFTCSDISFELNPKNGTSGIVPTGTTYSWNQPTVTGGITGGTAGSNSATVSGKLQNGTNLSHTATYSVSPNFSTCIGSNFILSVTVNSLPIAPVVATSAATCSSQGTATISNYDPNLTYVFTPSGPNVSSNGLINGMNFGTNYSVSARNNNNCVSLSSNQFAVTNQLVNPSTPSISISEANCLTSGTATITNYSSEVSYIFNPNGPIVGANGLISGLIPETSYSVVARNNVCSSTSSPSFSVGKQLPFDVPSFAIDKTSGCTPLSYALTASFKQGIVYQWFANGVTIGSGSTITNTLQKGGCFDITLTVSNSLGCSASKTNANMICAEQTPEAMFSSNPSSLSNLSETVKFTNNSIGAVSYLWNFGNGNTSTAVSPNIYYDNINGNIDVTLYAYSANNCVDSSLITLFYREEAIFYIPNSFTPDEDEFNQTWGPVFTQGFDPYNFDLYLFNRWGELIWESHDAQARWDGTYGSERLACQDGVYTWKISYKTKQTDQRIDISGSVRLLR